MSTKTLYLFGMPVEKIADNTYTWTRRGRPSDSGRYGEPTFIVRAPESLRHEIEALLAKCEQEWLKVRKAVLDGTYCSPEIDLGSIKVISREEADKIKAERTAEPSPEVVIRSPDGTTTAKITGIGDNAVSTASTFAIEQFLKPYQTDDTTPTTDSKKQRKRAKWGKNISHNR